MKRLIGSLFIGLVALTSVSCGTSETVTGGASQIAETRELVSFTIPAGTSRRPWNREADMVVVKVGDTLSIKNEDTIPHRIHTDGRPFAHGEDIAPGATVSYTILTTFEPSAGTFLYDHNFGVASKFWLRAIAAD